MSKDAGTRFVHPRLGVAELNRARDPYTPMPEPPPRSDAILIDPTAPETVAALAAALRTDHRDPATPGHGDCTWSADHEAQAAAVLPAFIARLRGET